jgi:predicted alpha/beta superfamily hydrolase
MQKSLLILLLTAILGIAKAQQPQPIVLGHIDTVYSTILKEGRPLWVYTPSFDTSYFSKPAYPVLYVLDGDGYFMSLVNMVQQLAVINGNTVLPEMIIVGILNTPGNRTRDLTPTHSAMDKASGGGEDFTAFMEKELIPYIDQHYATAPYRTLIGHSLGGLMVMNTLFNHTRVFNNYVALDPSMFYDNAKLLKQADNLLKHTDFKGKVLFLGLGNTMNEGMDTAQVRRDTSHITEHIRSILKLADVLKKYPSNNLKWAHRYYPDDDHASMPLIGEYDALRFIFNSNKFPRNQPENQYFDKALSAQVLQQMIRKHYSLLSLERGYPVRPPEFTINQTGYIMLQLKEYEKSHMFFQTNIDYYPKNFNTYDGMGDYYLTRNDKASAVKYFKKALSLKFTAEIADKLKKLQ